MRYPLSVCLPLLVIVLHTHQPTSAQGSDPCYNYTVLNDTWRATTNIVPDPPYNYKCDSAWGGYGIALQWQNWYLFVLQNRSTQMPDQCVQPFRCGTAAPIWLNGSHPRPEDGIVSRNVCVSWNSNCCYPTLNYIPPILVKACPGNYTVYKLVDPQWCNLAYCADASSNGLLPTNTLTPVTTNHVVGMHLRASTTATLNATEIEELILKPFGEILRAGGVNVSGIRLLSETWP